MQDVDVEALSRLVLGSAFGLSLAFGALLQRTHFCTMGAVADIVSMGDWTRMRMWVLAMAVAMLGFNGMVALGWVQAADTVYAGPQLLWLSSLAGGAMFGFGMVLASGCGSKTLVRIGSGNLKSLVVFLVMGITAYMTMRGITAVARVATIDRVLVELPGGQDLPSLLAPQGMPVARMALLVGGGLAAMLVAWVLARPEGRRAETLAGGIGVGAIVAALWWVSGRLGFVDEHPQTLEPTFLATSSRRMESLTFVAPAAYTLDWLMLFSDSGRRLTIGVVSVVGVVLGSALEAWRSGAFRWEGFRSREDTALHLAGGGLMGIGGVTAMGCTVGQGLSGVSTLALGSFIALAGIIAGALAALRWQLWRMERMA